MRAGHWSAFRQHHAITQHAAACLCHQRECQCGRLPNDADFPPITVIVASPEVATDTFVQAAGRLVAKGQHLRGSGRVQVHAGADSGVRLRGQASDDAPLMASLTAAEAAAMRLPMPKNMVQALRVAPSLCVADAGSSVVEPHGAPALRMVVTVPSRFCGVSVNHSGAQRHA